MKQVRKANFGKFNCTYSDVIDFLTRKRINVAFLEKGFVDPLLAASVSQINTLKDEYELTLNQLFRLLSAGEREDPGLDKSLMNNSSFVSGGHAGDKKKVGNKLSRENFVTIMQGMNLKLTVEDINELFNFIDDTGENRITRQKFVDSITFISSKMGGPSIVD